MFWGRLPEVRSCSAYLAQCYQWVPAEGEQAGHNLVDTQNGERLTNVASTDLIEVQETDGDPNRGSD